MRRSGRRQVKINKLPSARVAAATTIRCGRITRARYNNIAPPRALPSFAPTASERGHIVYFTGWRSRVAPVFAEETCPVTASRCRLWYS